MSEYRLPDGTVPVLLSSDSAAVLAREATTLLTYLAGHPDVTPARVADMLFRTRIPRRHRALAMAGSRDELIAALRAIADGRAHPAVLRPGAPATGRRPAFVFPGQGGQRPGMGRLFYDRMPAFRAEIDRCTALFEELFGASPRSYLLDADSADASGADDIARIVQPALFAQMAGLAAMWRAAGIAPRVVVGHSQGEIAAAYVSGAMTLADAVLVVGTRARAVDTISSDRYAMAVAAVGRDECERLLARNSGWAQVSVINSPNLVGISGDRPTVREVVDTLTAHDRFARLIRVGYPAHTDRVSEFRTELQEAVHGRLTNQVFLEPEIPCLGATLGEAISTDLPVDDYWFWNLRNTVRFDLAIEAALAREIDTFVELADHPTLALSVQENLTRAGASATVTATSVRTADDLSEFTRNLANLAVADLNYRWDALRVDTAPPALPLPDFPNTGMDEQRLWLPYNDSGVSPAVAARPVAPESTGHAATARPQVVVEQWQRPQRRSLSAPHSLAIVDHTGACAELAAALCDEAEYQGARARRIEPESRPDTGEADTVVVLLPNKAGPDAVAEIARFFGDRDWWFDAAAEVKQWWLVTVGGESVLAEDPPPDPVPAAAAAGFRCLGAEYPGVAFRHLDLAAGTGGAENAAAVVTALHTAGEPELALRGAATYVKRLAEPEPAQPVEVPGHVLILGGTGGVGLEYCRYFAEAGTHRITLVSRSGAGPAAERIAAIGAGSATDIRVLACDVGDAAAVATLADELRSSPVDLVLHAAADIAELTNVELTAVTRDRVERALRGKVTGITAVLNALTLSDECRVLLCSSLAASIGGRGMAVYAAANRMLDAMAYRLRADGVAAVSIQWGQWAMHKGVGTSETEVLASVGYLPMSPERAIALSLTELPANAIVTAFDWELGRAVLGQFGYGPLLTELRAPEAGEDEERGPESTGAAGDSVPAPDRVLRILAEVIGADDVAGIDTAQPLVAIGLDSLQALEMRRRVDAEFHYELPVADLIGGASLDDVLRMLGASPAPVGAVTPAVAPKHAEAARYEGNSDPATDAAPVAGMPAYAGAAADHVLPAELDAERIRSARRDMDLFGLRAMLAVLEPVLSDADFRTADELAARLEFAPRHHWLLRAWLGELARHGCLESDAGRGYRYRAPVAEPVRPDLYRVVADLGYEPSFATFLTGCDDNLLAIAQDRALVQEWLFPNGDTATANTFYRDNLGSRYLNAAARAAVADLAAQRATPIRILELGAGVGGLTDEVLAGLAGIPIDYHFTDLSTFFLNAARKKYRSVPGMRFGLLDMNTDLPGHAPRDIVLASNVLHNATHIGQTVRQLHELLAPGGAVVFLEFCHAHCQMLTSVHFLMSPPADGRRAGSTDVRAGTDRIFLTEAQWRAELGAAGLAPRLVLPTSDHPLSALDQHVFVAVREG